ncbi:MAG: chemotaxis protein [Alphaproteobacteria bacterium]|nr:MAG: chemotaxis protein [Alphaproteobacteria bacterium]
MSLKQLGLKWKIAGAVVAVCAVGFAAVIGLVTWIAVDAAKRNADTMAQEIAARYAAEVQSDLSVAMDAARNLAHAFEGMKVAGQAGRQAFDRVLANVLEQNPQLLGTWTVWAPNALDGQDSFYADKAGHDATGRYIPYWHRDDKGGIVREPLLDYETPGIGDYYLLARDSGNETVLDPYSYEVNGKATQMTTLAAPIRVDGKIVGVAGVDIALSSLDEMVREIRPYGTGTVGVLGNGGSYAAHGTEGLTGKPLGEGDGFAGVDGVLEAVQSGQPLQTVVAIGGEEMLSVLAPIEIGKTTTPWSLVVTVPLESALADANRLRDIALVVGAASILFGALCAWLFGSSLARPVIAMAEAMRRLVQGDHAVEVPALDREDEIGQMAKSVQVFKDNAVEMERLKAEQAEAERRAADEKKRLMNELADGFETSVGGIVEKVTASANEMQSTAQTLTATAEETSRQSTAVAAASEQASTNVQTVASAAEELSSSIAEISRQVAQSAEIAGQAVADAERSNRQVQGLAEAAQRIGEVVQLITDIASQTNLLALNATIEAARAGEAGKGFAVVASEVKNLANETAKATDEITGQIAGIQQATRDAVDAIQAIGETIGRINEIATTIASAVEEQGAATQEIARNVQQAAAGTQEVSSNIAGVTQAAGDTGAAASQMLAASGELARQGDVLSGEVGKFLQAVRAA